MKKRILALTMSVLLVVSSMCGAFAEKEPAETTEKTPDIVYYNDDLDKVEREFCFEEVASNDRFVLRCDADNQTVSIEDKATNQIWYSSPPVNAKDLGGEAVSSVKSVLYVSFVNSSNVQKYIYSSMSESVTTEVTKLADGSGVRFDFDFFQFKFKIPVTFRLNNENNSVEASVLLSEIDEYGDNRVTSIDFLKYFAAAREGSEGYLVIPDGSGAIIDFDNGNNLTDLEFKKPFYGDDAAELTSKTVETSRKEDVTLPIYAIVTDNAPYEDEVVLQPIYDKNVLALEAIEAADDAVGAAEDAIDDAIDAHEDTVKAQEDLDAADESDADKLAEAQTALDDAVAAEDDALAAAVLAANDAVTAVEAAQALCDELTDLAAGVPEQYLERATAAAEATAEELTEIATRADEAVALAANPFAEETEAESDEEEAEAEEETEAEAETEVEAEPAVAVEGELEGDQTPAYPGPDAEEPAEDEAEAEILVEDTEEAPDEEVATDAVDEDVADPDEDVTEDGDDEVASDDADGEEADDEADVETEEETAEPEIAEDVPQYGVLAEVTSGAEIATLRAFVSGNKLNGNFNSAYTTITYRESYKIPLKGQSSASDVLYNAEDATSLETFTITYRFSDTDETDYNTIANMYRDVLINEKGWLDSEGDITDRFYMELYGAAEKKKSFAGLVYNARETLTSFDDALSIIQELKDAQVDNLHVMYNTYSDDYFNGDMEIELGASDSLGGQEALTSLLTESKDRLNTNIAMAADFQSFYNGGNGVSTFWDVADVINISPIEVYPFALNANAMDTSKSPYYLLDPQKYGETVDTLIASAKEKGYTSLYFDEEAVQLYSDLAPEGFQAERTSVAQKEQYERLAGEGFEITMSNPNAYLYQFADYIVDVPVCSSKEVIFDDDIPLLQAVLRGSKNFSGESMNINDVSDESFLRHLEYGTNMKYSLIKGETELLLKTDMTFLYSATYNTFKDQIVERCAALEDYSAAVKDSYIVDHTREDGGNVAITTYSNGAKVYVNYGDEAYTTDDGKVIESMSYLISEEV